MNLDKLAQQIEGMRLRVAFLQSDSITQKQEEIERLTAALEELNVAIEELQIAYEELQHQNEQLRNVQGAVEAERQRYQELFELAPDAYLVTDICGKILEANSSASALLNTPKFSLVGKPLISYLVKEEHQVFRHKLYQLCQVDAISSMEVCLQPRKRIPMTASVRVATVRNQNGQLIALRWLLLDITEQKKVQQELNKAKAELEIKVKERTAELTQANLLLQRLAYLDGLTQIGNRHCFNDYLNKEWYLLAQGQGSIALILCDVDYFKRYNDYYGHLAGDNCLVQIAQAISYAVKRSADLVTRFGGEEFAVILPHTDTVGAVKVACAILEEVKQLNIPHVCSPINQQVTLSIGVASTFPSPNCSPQVLINRADQALYLAKEEGRNCYCVYPNL